MSQPRAVFLPSCDFHILLLLSSQGATKQAIDTTMRASNDPQPFCIAKVDHEHANRSQRLHLMVSGRIIVYFPTTIAPSRKYMVTVNVC